MGLKQKIDAVHKNGAQTHVLAVIQYPEKWIFKTQKTFLHNISGTSPTKVNRASKEEIEIEVLNGK